ncbi:hypothetical protein AB0M43_05700 [Longispora sp. NPDC051575]|uniref:TolB family protein n=1 Tax=Longispora sp. NPDC051575 TaxID=3154943 RepID=UPI00343562F9
MTATLAPPARATRPDRRRPLLGIALIVTTLLAGGAYVALRPGHDTSGGPPVDLTRPGTMLYVAGSPGRVTQAALAEPGRVLGSGPACERAYAAAGILVCLRTDAAPGSTRIVVYDAHLAERRTLSAWGTPSRARVSPSGRFVAWTVFRDGDSYLNEGRFSTTAGLYDLETGTHHGSLEDYAVTVDGRPYSAPDMNFWGVTFARDDRTFYATMSSAGRTWLMRGDIGTRRMTAERGNVECPSLSPDGTRIAYKFRTGDRWRLHVLTLATGADVPLAEPAHVDDQPTWLDPATIAYSRPEAGRPTLFAVPADGTGTPRLLRADATSPAPLP